MFSVLSPDGAPDGSCGRAQWEPRLRAGVRVTSRQHTVACLIHERSGLGSVVPGKPRRGREGGPGRMTYDFRGAGAAVRKGGQNSPHSRAEAADR